MLPSKRDQESDNQSVRSKPHSVSANMQNLTIKFPSDDKHRKCEAKLFLSSNKLQLAMRIYDKKIRAFSRNTFPALYSCFARWKTQINFPICNVSLGDTTKCREQFVA